MTGTTGPVLPSRWLAMAVPVAMLAALSIPLLMGGGLVVKLYIHDVFFQFDSLWRVARGEVAHIDFHTPVGQAFYWPYAILSRLGDLDALTVIHAHVLVGAVLAVAMMLTLPRRLSLAELLLTSGAILAMALTPRDFDARGSLDYSFLAPYNRWGWALFMLLVQVALLRPAKQTARGAIVDGIVLGLLGALLYYMKITFFLAAGAILLVALALRFMSFRTMLIAVGTLLASMLAVELIWHNNMAYIDDLAMAAAGAREVPVVSNIWQLPAVVQISAVATIGSILLLLSGQRDSTPIAQLGAFGRWKSLGAVAAVLLIGTALTVQNHPMIEYGQCVIAVLLAWQYSRRSPAFEPGSGSRMVVRWAVLIVAIGWTMLLPLKDVRAIMAYPGEARSPYNCRIPELAGSRAAALMVPATIIAGKDRDAAPMRCAEIRPDPTLRATEEKFSRQIWKLRTVTALLRRHAKPGEVIFPLDFTNPYPFIRNSPPPRQSMSWWSAGRTYAPSRHPDPAVLLGSTDVAVQLKDDTTFEPDGVWSVYGDYVERHFTNVYSDDRIGIWRRKGVKAR